MRPIRTIAFSFYFLTIIALAACTATPTPTLPQNPTASPSTAATPLPSATPATPATPVSSPTAGASSSVSQIAAAFVAADNNVYTWIDGNSSFTQITESGDAQTAVISTDGQLVAYSRTTDGFTYTLDVVASDGTNHRTIFTHDDFLGITRPSIATDSEPYQFAWVPNSHMLAMTVDYVMEGPGLVTAPDLILFSVDTGTFQTLLQVNETYQFFYSPNGSKIAIALPDGIDLYDSNGNRLLSPKFYSFANVNTASEVAFLPKIIWSMDSASFAFTVPPAEPFTDTETLTKVVEINSATGAATTLLTASMAFQMPQEISPNLAQIAYLKSDSPNSTEFNLHIASLDGGPDKVVAAKTLINDFSWSPDSLHFAYSIPSGMTLREYLGKIQQTPAQITQVNDARGFAWIDTVSYLVLDKTSSGWKIWLGKVGSAPVVVYTDSLTTGTDLSLSVNR